MVVGALLLALGAVLVPASWGPFAGRLQVTGPLHGSDATRGAALPVTVVSQYQGLPTDPVNCGPAAVAAVLRYARPEFGTMDTAALVQAVRTATGAPEGATYLPELAHALAVYGIPSAPLYAGDAPSGATTPLAAVRVALQQGRPVLALVRGATLGRGTAYGNHYVVMIGLDPQTGQVTVVDPDTQAPRSAQWEPGGRQQWSRALAQAALAGTGQGAVSALVVGAERRGALPPWAVFLPAAVILAVLGVRPRRRWRHVLPGDSATT